MKTPIYIGYNFTVSPIRPGSEILIAELGQLGFESFVETENGVDAFIQKNDWYPDILKDVYVISSGEFEIEFTNSEIPQVNWNTEWEKNFEPITIDGICTVRAPFHTAPDTQYDIIVEPKMSFGTGHHETTSMMIRHIIATEFKDKNVLDMGCGTGVLAILAEMKGAARIDAIDVDNWCYLNTLENCERNNCNRIVAREGDVSLIKGKQYDIILANINRNILLADIPAYVSSLSVNGKLFLSGFYEEDLDQISHKCREHGLQLVVHDNKNNWIAACYRLN